MLKTCIAVIFSFLTFSAFSQYRTGLILPENFLESNRRDSFCCVLFPDSMINLYQKPEGKKLGKICRRGDSNDDENYYDSLYYKLKKQKPVLIGKDILREIGFDTYCFGYDDIQNGFVRIFTPKANYWISLYELHKMNYCIRSWKDFILKSTGKVTGFYPKQEGMNLMLKPNENSKIITRMKGEEFEITPTGLCNGNWYKVKVKHYKKNPCIADKTDEPNLLKTFDGWIQLVDSTGNPLLWFYTHNCTGY
ncbi:MAG: hypothetical protein WCO54_02370 [Bacteroidota bacterium]